MDFRLWLESMEIVRYDCTITDLYLMQDGIRYASCDFQVKTLLQ